MTDTVPGAFRLHDAPMVYDRTDGWQYVREQGDVFEAEGTWYLTSPEAVQYAHRHPEIFSSARAFDSLASPVPLVPIAMDQPDHQRFRKLLDPMLAPRVVNRMEDGLRAQVRELIGAFAGDGHCDVVAQLGRLYPTQVFLTLFGLPLEDRDKFIHWAETVIENSTGATTAEPSEKTIEAAMALFSYLQRYVDEKRQHPGDDMLSQVLAAEGDDAMSGDEVLGMCFLFVLAGLDTVTASIGFMLLHLAQNPDVRRRIIEDPSVIPAVIEEVLRLEPPAPITPRVTTADVEVCGVTIPAGSRVNLCLGSVNRDPERFATANTIDLSQGDRGHLAFGGGIHRCLGSHLARRELRLLVEEWHKIIPEYELAPGTRPTLVWPSGTFHLSALPLVFPTAGASS
ncbi:MAG: cytochrome P450 [Acidimicrobiia bacterium]